MKTRVILRKDIAALGMAGEVVEVTSGHARNFLVPRGHAYAFTKDGMQRVHKDREAAEQRRQLLQKEHESLAARLSSTQVTFEEKVSPEGHLYGSVNAQRIADALVEQGFEVTDRSVKLAEPLRETGEFQIVVHVHGDIEATVKVWVVASAETAAPAAAPAQGADEAAKS
ncbi:MAG TPA: 50S ribosomal protein L9 [Planctomycetota bacterium]